MIRDPQVREDRLTVAWSFTGTLGFFCAVTWLILWPEPDGEDGMQTMFWILGLLCCAVSAFISVGAWIRYWLS